MSAAVPIALVAGPVKTPDRLGHHDYAGGCALLGALLQQSPGVAALQVREGWPRDEAVPREARALLFYSGGGRKHAFLQSPERLECMQAAVDRGVGLVMLHQAVRFPVELAERAISWLGGVHAVGNPARGHWWTRHAEFPDHPATRGVQPWTIKDGWLNGIRFAEGMAGVTPLVWSGRENAGSPAGGAPDVVAWAYQRPGGGRSFCFTGLDAHSAWGFPGLRQLIVNATLWCAGQAVPPRGAPCALEDGELAGFLTPRGSRAAWLVAGGRRLARRWLRAEPPGGRSAHTA